MQPVDFLKQHNIKFRLSGDELEIGCILPECPNNGQPQMYINKNTGLWHCHRCGESGGNIHKLAYKAGLLQFLEPVRNDHLYIPPNEIDAWHEALFQNREALEYLTNQRGLSENALHQFRLGFKYDCDRPVIVIPFFDNTHTCVGYKKYYFKGGVKPKCKLEKNSKIIFYNLNCIDTTEPLLVTEGEFDAISLWDYGYVNVGSVPNGADSVGDWTEGISNAPKFYLTTDNDDAGVKCAKKLSEKLGVGKCYRVYPRTKDMNDALKAGVPSEIIDEWVEKADPMFKVDHVSVQDYMQEAIEKIADPEGQKGLSTGYKSLDEKLGGYRMNEITVLTGETGNGKSEFTNNNIGNWLRQDQKVLVISGEAGGDDLLLKLTANHFRRKPTKEDVMKFSEMNKDKLFIPNIYAAWEDSTHQLPMDKMFAMIDHYVERGVTFFVVDHLHCFVKKGQKLVEEIEEFMTRCRIRVRQYPIHLFLVAQCRKKSKDQRKLTKDDLYGSAEIDHTSWNIMVIHRENEKDHLVEIDVQKNRKFANLGSVMLQFDVNTNANYYEVKK